MPADSDRMPGDPEGWGEYRKLVLKELERLNQCVESLTRQLAETTGKTSANTAATDRLSANLAKIVWLLVAAIVSGLAGMLFRIGGH